MDKDVIKKYAAGEFLFREGEPGGDLIFIMSGTVRIFKQSGQHEVVLSKLGKGDVIGVMTALTKNPRSADAVAEEETSARVVSALQFEKLMTTIPTWMKVMLKDLTDKIIKTNSKVVDLDQRVETLEESEPTPTRIAAQIINGMHLVGELMLHEEATNKYVMVEELRPILAKLLGVRRNDFDHALELIETIAFARLSARSRDPKKWYWNHILALSPWPDYMEKLRHDRPFKARIDALHTKDRRAMQDMLDLVTHLKLADEVEAQLDCADIERLLAKQQKSITRVSIDKAAEICLVRIENVEGDKVIFTPARLRQELIWLELYRKLDPSAALKTKQAA